MDTSCAHATKQVALPLDVKAGEKPGTFEGYGAVFGNRDRDGDIVARGAFAESLKSGMPVLLWQHDQKAPIGRFDDVREDDKGLYVKGRLSMSGRGEEAYELLKMGALDGLSIGFVTKEASRDPASATRTITKADLMEISLVTFPANELARVSAVKSVNQINEDTMMPEAPVSDARSFERMLRANGFSRSRAKAITAKGFKTADFEADESVEIAEMVAELKQRQIRFEEKSSALAFFERLLGSTRVIMSLRLFPGKSKTIRLPKVKLGRVTFKVDAPDFADWECAIEYYNFSSGRPVREQETLYVRKGNARDSVTVNRGKPPKFNPLSASDWKKQFPEQLVLDSTKATFTYLKFDEPALDDLRQRASTFSLSVTS